MAFEGERTDVAFVIAKDDGTRDDEKYCTSE